MHFSFDIWTSSNSLAITGVFVHFIDHAGKIWNFLLGLPQHHDAHGGYNIAETIGATISYWGLQSKSVYFTCDNATNNDTCLQWLGHEFGFESEARRIRCVSHVLNLVAKAVLIGTSEVDVDVFEKELDSMAKDERKALMAWRKRGPVGRLHNIVVFISRSTQRIEACAALQRQAIQSGH